jgi:hypothetical protein
VILSHESNSLPVKEWGKLALLIGFFFLLAVLTYNHSGEDAYISFRYARNLANGLGLVYNEGERVEGYSNLLWVLIMTPFAWLRLPLDVVARILSSVCFAGLIVFSRLFTDKKSPKETPLWIKWALPIALAFQPLLHYHDDRGLETVPYAILLSLTIMLLSLGTRWWIPSLLAGLAVITRPEAIGFVIAMVPCVYLSKNNNLRTPKGWKQILLFLSVPLSFFLAQLIFRHFYYGEWVPNTTIAKKAGSGGLTEALALITSHSLLPLSAMAGLIWGLGKPAWRSLAIGCLALIGATFLFQLKVGAVYNVAFRYQIPLIIPCVLGAWMLLVFASETISSSRYFKVSSRAILSPLAAILFLQNLILIFIPGDNYLYFRGNTDAPRSRFHSRLFDYTTYQIPSRLNWYFSPPIYINSQVGRWLSENLPEECYFATDQMGQIGYFAGENQQILDTLGLMDAHVARKGLSQDYLKEQAPDYLVLQACLNSSYWPKVWREKPTLPAMKQLTQQGGFSNLYRPRWFLQANKVFLASGYMVYIRNDLDDENKREDLWIGTDHDTFESAWRVEEK